MSTASTQLLDIQRDQWLTDVLGFNVWRVVPFPAQWQTVGESLIDELRAHSQGQIQALYYAKIGVEQVRLLHALNAAGMAVVDVNITLEIASKALQAMQDEQTGIQIVKSRPQDAKRLLEIASTSF